MISHHFRLFLLGRIPTSATSAELTVLAEFAQGRALERVEITASMAKVIEDQIVKLRSSIESGDDFDNTGLTGLGSALFDFVIQGSVRDLFHEATGNHGDIRQSGRFLPLEIIAEDFRIAGWPWEYMYHDRRKQFLCREFHPISRDILERSIMRMPARSDGKVRVLLILGNSMDNRGASAEEEVDHLKEVFDSYLPTGSVEMTFIRQGTRETVVSALEDGHFDIFHFYGHAAFDERKLEGYVKLDNQEPSRSTRWYASELASSLANQRIRLVFLNACETAKGSDLLDRSSVAGALLANGIPAVVATQFSMPGNSAHYFSSRIYSSLAHGDNISDAVRNGRIEMLYDDESRFFDWGIPVLYATNPRMTLFEAANRHKPLATDGTFVAERASVGAAEHGSQTSADVELSDIVEPVSRSTDNADSHVKQSLDVGYSSSVVQGVSGPALSIPSFPVARTASPLNTKIRVALADLDAGVSFLADLVRNANEVQGYYEFDLLFPPMPSGAIHAAKRGSKKAPNLYLPHIASYLSRLPKQLGADSLICITQCMIAGVWEGAEYSDFFSSSLDPDSNVAAVSTFAMRDYAIKSGCSFAYSVFWSCLGELIMMDSRWKVQPHDETVGCLLDFCWNRNDIVVGLRHREFDHEKCRRQIGDEDQLKAIDALVGLEIPDQSSQ